MSIGTGLFLSTVILSFILLYGFTKDRWRWRAGIKRIILGAFAITLIGVIAWGGLYLWNHLPTRAALQSEYWGVRLGMSPNEVMYIKGYPPTVLGEPIKDDKWKGFLEIIETKNLAEGKTANDYQYWGYGSITVKFDDSKKEIVKVSCYSNDKLKRCPELAGVVDGDSEKEAIQKLGNPDRSQINGVTKRMLFGKYGIELVLTTEQVYLLSILVPTEYLN